MKVKLLKFAGLLLIVTLIAVLGNARRDPRPALASESPVRSTPAGSNNTHITGNTPVQTNPPPTVVNNDSFQRRPFPPTIERATHGWTAEDGRDLNVIAQLAHNNLEYARMVDENDRIQRRQLVYRAKPTAAVVQDSKLSGAPMTRLTLPGLDGREIDVEIQNADLNPSGQQGMFTGRIAGQPDSMVTLAFKGGREAFTVLSPSEGLFLQADPREPGELIVKQIDPATYVPGVCGTP